MIVVLDASVVIKWLLNDPRQEPDTEKAQQLIEAIVQGGESVCQPPHWLAEVAAVLARVSPATARDDVVMLSALELPVNDDPQVLERACALAIDLEQHVFDTLYHAVALQAANTVLITADDRYFRAARSVGRIESLATWR